jgi:hypothetical protein
MICCVPTEYLDCSQLDVMERRMYYGTRLMGTQKSQVPA